MQNKVRMAILAAGTLVLAVAFQPAQAACDVAVIFSSSGATNGFEQHSYVQTAPLAGTGTGVQGSDVSANLRGHFWIIGSGDPDDLPSPGHDDGAPTQHPAIEPPGTIDNGSGAAGWIRSYLSVGTGSFPGAFINSHWATDPRVDGCPEAVAAQPTCQAVILSDTIGNRSYFAAITASELVDGNYDLSQPGNAPIVLQPVPKPRIIASSRYGNHVAITIGWPLPSAVSAGSYLDPDCAPVLTGYRIYRRAVPRGTPPSPNRDRSTWEPLTGSIPFDQHTTVFTDCSPLLDEDEYLAHTFTADSGFELQFVSENSARIECGPQLADPQPRPPEARPGERLPPRRR